MCNLSKNKNFGPLFTILDLLFEPLMHGFLMQHTEVNIMKKKSQGKEDPHV
jgi:sterol desaturase/sphingolipid hydroxylase (fatty acid hydroxylase superfamily)